jgi:hypothetical protein
MGLARPLSMLASCVCVAGGEVRSSGGMRFETRAREARRVGR